MVTNCSHGGKWFAPQPRIRLMRLVYWRDASPGNEPPALHQQIVDFIKTGDIVSVWEDVVSEESSCHYVPAGHVPVRGSCLQRGCSPRKRSQSAAICSGPYVASKASRSRSSWSLRCWCKERASAVPQHGIPTGASQ